MNIIYFVVTESFDMWHYFLMVAVGLVVLFTTACLTCLILLRWRKDKNKKGKTHHFISPVVLVRKLAMQELELHLNSQM